MFELKTEAIVDSAPENFVELAELLLPVELEMVGGGHATVNNI